MRPIPIGLIRSITSEKENRIVPAETIPAKSVSAERVSADSNLANGLKEEHPDGSANALNCASPTLDPLASNSLEYPQAMRRFDQAILAYKGRADPLTLLLLNKSAIPLMDLQDNAWKLIDEREVFSPERPFAAVRVLCDRRLDAGQIECLAGCLGYAFQAILAGPELSAPCVARVQPAPETDIRAAFTVVEFTYEAGLSGRTAPDYAEAFAKAREYIRGGTPIRTTDKAGAQTQGTRLVEGLGAVNLSFYVR